MPGVAVYQVGRVGLEAEVVVGNTEVDTAVLEPAEAVPMEAQALAAMGDLAEAAGLEMRMDKAATVAWAAAVVAQAQHPAMAAQLAYSFTTDRTTP